MRQGSLLEGRGLFPQRNNLEWMRLFFALQVVVSHMSTYLDNSISLPVYLSNFPGVPAFFFVSGFLIYASYMNSQGRRFFENRALRLMPGLILVTLGGGGIILYAKGFGSLIDHFSTYIVWFFSQVTIGQAYNPEFFRDVGIGVINGSLWTITVEIIFYLIVPIIVYLESRFRIAVLILILISYAAYVATPIFLNQAVYGNKTIYDVMALSPIIWGWMFGFGILAVKYFWLYQRWIKYFPVVFFPILLILINIGDGPIFGSSGNRLGLVYFICYVALIVWCAFSTPCINLSFDFSYGLYIWHGPIINILIVLLMPNIYIGIGLTFLMAAFSWFFVEKPMLKLKKKSIHPV